jgi:hypothetical protein
LIRIAENGEVHVLAVQKKIDGIHHLMDAEAEAQAARVARDKLELKMQKDKLASQTSSVLKSLGLAKAAAAIDAAIATKDAFAAAQSTYKYWSAAFPPAAPVAYAISLAAGLAQARQVAVSAFARGGDFETSGPQLIMVGDNPGGRERVSITPTSSPNYDGPQGGVNININAAYVDEDAVKNHLLPMVELQLARGLA